MADIRRNWTIVGGMLLAGALGLRALAGDPGFARGLNVHAGHITHEAVARDLGLGYQPYAFARG